MFTGILVGIDAVVPSSDKYYRKSHDGLTFSFKLVDKGPHTINNVYKHRRSDHNPLQNFSMFLFLILSLLKPVFTAEGLFFWKTPEFHVTLRTFKGPPMEVSGPFD